jgi:hypothetical protein
MKCSVGAERGGLRAGEGDLMGLQGAVVGLLTFSVETGDLEVSAGEEEQWEPRPAR